MKDDLLFNSFPIIETSRLYLKPILENKCEELFMINNDPDVKKEISNGQSYTIADTYYTINYHYPKLFVDRKAIIWGMYLKSTDQLIGLRMCFFEEDEWNTVSIQGSILPNFRRMGYTYEAYLSIINFLETADVKQIISNCSNSNIAAMELLKKLGFTSSIGHEIEYGPARFFVNFYVKELKSGEQKQIQKPKNFFTAFDEAKKLYEAENFDEALQFIEWALEYNDKNAPAYLLKGKIEQVVAGNVVAMLSFKSAIERDEYCAEAYRRLGICQYNVSSRNDAHNNWQIASSLGDELAQKLIKKYLR